MAVTNPAQSPPATWAMRVDGTVLDGLASRDVGRFDRVVLDEMLVDFPGPAS